MVVSVSELRITRDRLKLVSLARDPGEESLDTWIGVTCVNSLTSEATSLERNSWGEIPLKMRVGFLPSLTVKEWLSCFMILIGWKSFSRVLFSGTLRLPVGRVSISNSIVLSIFLIRPSVVASQSDPSMTIIKSVISEKSWSFVNYSSLLVVTTKYVFPKTNPESGPPDIFSEIYITFPRAKGM